MTKARAPNEPSASRLRRSESGAGPATGRDGLPHPGDTIANKYAVVRLLGEGGMGAVYEATHLRLRQRLAIKVLRPDAPDFDDVMARFEREARATAQLRSIHTARIVDVDTLASGLPYIVMEYLEGADLDVILQKDGVLPVDRAVDIVRQVAEAMAEAHSLGIVHRDLKPSNLFVCQMGDRQLVKVLDFGISKTDSDDGQSRLTQDGQYFGTPCYAAPEQLRSASEADARSDIWSLGIVLYELLTGRPPFVGNPTSVIARVMTDPIPWPLELRPDLPPDVARLVMRALKRDPAERFRSMRELSDALAPFGPAQSVAAIAEAQRPRSRLGEILVAEGLLSPKDLQRALDEQRQSGKLLGRVLLDLGLVAQTDLLTALAKQQGILTSPAVTATEEERRARTAVTVAPRGRRIGLVVAIAVPLVLVAVLAIGLAIRAEYVRTTPSVPSAH
ncbi:MAG TPA: protein kinase [Polyangiaceae bacterium]|nr:protein kinase [Polyangiaceae bacterium]